MRSIVALPIAFCVASACLPRLALADPTPAERVAARTLFADAQAAMANLDFRTACPKFAESQRLDPGVGTLYHLGVCYEAQGRIASAWSTFRDAAETARRAGQSERSARARARADALEARIPWLSVTIIDADHPRLSLDGSPFADSLVGTSVPLDPGPHELVAEAAGKKTWTMQVAPKEGATLAISVPALEDVPSPPPPVLPPPPPPVPIPSEPAIAPPVVDVVPPPRRGPGWQVPAAVVAEALGVVAIGFGIGYGVTSFNDWSDAKREGCTGSGSNGSCPQAGAGAWASAHNAGVASTAAFVVGGVLVAGGAVLWFTRPRDGVSVGLRSDGVLVVAGRFP